MKLIRFLMFLFLLIPTHLVYATSQKDVVISLIEVRNDSSGSVIFIFQVSGKISKSNLNNGYVQVQGGNDYGLHCNQTDENTVQCTTSKKTGGENVVVGFAGSKFWAYIPESKPVTDCYNIYDWDDSFNPTQWVLYGTYCQDYPAQDGDEITWINPYLLPPYIYTYSSSAQPSWCTWAGMGPGYYYPFCLD